MTPVPASLTAKKTMKMTFFSKKIYCISSRNVLNITNIQNPKWLHAHFEVVNCSFPFAEQGVRITIDKYNILDAIVFIPRLQQLSKCYDYYIL